MNFRARLFRLKAFVAICRDIDEAIESLLRAQETPDADITSLALLLPIPRTYKACAPYREIAALWPILSELRDLPPHPDQMPDWARKVIGWSSLPNLRASIDAVIRSLDLLHTQLSPFYPPKPIHELELFLRTLAVARAGLVLLQFDPDKAPQEEREAVRVELPAEKPRWAALWQATVDILRPLVRMATDGGAGSIFTAGVTSSVGTALLLTLSRPSVTVNTPPVNVMVSAPAATGEQTDIRQALDEHTRLLQNIGVGIGDISTNLTNTNKLADKISLDIGGISATLTNTNKLADKISLGIGDIKVALGLGDKPGTPVPTAGPCDKTVNISHDMARFPVNEATLTSDMHRELALVAARMLRCGKQKLMVVGHTDEIHFHIPERGRNEYLDSYRLSNDRAQNAAQKLSALIDSKEIVYVGTGPALPRVANRAGSGSEFNRRVEIQPCDDLDQCVATLKSRLTTNYDSKFSEPQRVTFRKLNDTGYAVTMDVPVKPGEAMH